jgi:hypothetical protein
MSVLKFIIIYEYKHHQRYRLVTVADLNRLRYMYIFMYMYIYMHIYIYKYIYRYCLVTVEDLNRLRDQGQLVYEGKDNDLYI